MNKISIKTGKDAIICVYKESLKAKRIDTICTSRRYADVIGDYFDNDYLRALADKSIAVREMLPGNLPRQIQLNKESESDLLLFGGKAVLISFDKDEPFALVVEDKEIVAMLSNMFEGLWRKGE